MANIHYFFSCGPFNLFLRIWIVVHLKNEHIVFLTKFKLSLYNLKNIHISSKIKKYYGFKSKYMIKVLYFFLYSYKIFSTALQKSVATMNWTGYKPLYKVVYILNVPKKVSNLPGASRGVLHCRNCTTLKFCKKKLSIYNVLIIFWKKISYKTPI